MSPDMRIPCTQIVGVNSSALHVEIMVRFEGTDTSEEPMKIHVSPHQKWVHFHFSNIGRNNVVPNQLSSNSLEAHLVSDEVAQHRFIKV